MLLGIFIFSVLLTSLKGNLFVHFQRIGYFVSNFFFIIVQTIRILSKCIYIVFFIAIFLLFIHSLFKVKALTRVMLKSILFCTDLEIVVLIVLLVILIKCVIMLLRKNGTEFRAMMIFPQEPCYLNHQSFDSVELCHQYGLMVKYILTIKKNPVK